MRKIIIAAMLLFGLQMSAQVMVDGKDLNKEVETFEVYLMMKPFSTKESIFANSGLNDFKLQNYDSKKQSILNAEGKKFEKGQVMELYNYLSSQGWEKVDERSVSLGNQSGKAIIFKKKTT